MNEEIKISMGDSIIDNITTHKYIKRLKTGYSLVDTGRIHKDKHGYCLCKIMRLVVPEGKYSGAKLRALRAQRGVGSVRKVKACGPI